MECWKGPEIQPIIYPFFHYSITPLLRYSLAQTVSISCEFYFFRLELSQQFF